MRSLTAKLVVAFFVTSIAGVGLAALFIPPFVTQEFREYVTTQQRAGFISDVTAYYEQRGSWAGVGEWFRGRIADSQRRPPPRGAGQSAPPLAFTLVDDDGRVLIPSQSYRPGQVVEPGVVSGGTPILSSGQVIATVLTPQRELPLGPTEQRYVARANTALGIAGGIMVCIALALGVLFARLITRPLREITTAAQKISEGDLDQRVPVRSRDELGLLASQFNKMSSDLSRATELRRQMTADIAHDLRTPLTVISGYLEALRDRIFEPTPYRFGAMHDEVQLLLHLVEDLHTLSLADAGELLLQRQSIAPQQLLERVAGTYKPAAEQRGIDLCAETEQAAPTISVDVEQMSRVLSNLVGNALRYTPPGGRISLRARTTTGRAELIVSDTGTGIAPEHLPSIFERFYRADKSREQSTGDSGLGLAIVKSIVEAHGGQVSVDSALGRGTTFTIALPQ